MLRAILFDFNGVIVDDEPIHLQAFQKVLSVEGIPLTEQAYNNIYIGMDDKGAFTHAFKTAGKALPSTKLQQLMEDKAACYDEMIRTDIRFFPGVKEFISRVANQYELAIVSGALQREVEAILAAGKLTDYFKILVTAEQVQEGKPNPEGYQLAVQQLHDQLARKGEKLQAEECLAIEDTFAGIEAAKGAGIKCLALSHSFSLEQLRVKADFVAPSFLAIDLPAIAVCYQ